MEKTLKVDVVNAEESLFSGNAEFVALPGIEGELGILPGHTPLITLIRPGLVRIRKSAQDEEEIFVAGGVLEIQPFHVIVLADVAIRSKDLDEAKAKEARKKQRRLQRLLPANRTGEGRSRNRYACRTAPHPSENQTLILVLVSLNTDLLMEVSEFFLFCLD